MYTKIIHTILNEVEPKDGISMFNFLDSGNYVYK